MRAHGWGALCAGLAIDGARVRDGGAPLPKTVAQLSEPPGHERVPLELFGRGAPPSPASLRRLPRSTRLLSRRRLDVFRRQAPRGVWRSIPETELWGAPAGGPGATLPEAQAGLVGARRAAQLRGRLRGRGRRP